MEDPFDNVATNGVNPYSATTKTFVVNQMQEGGSVLTYDHDYANSSRDQDEELYVLEEPSTSRTQQCEAATFCQDFVKEVIRKHSSVMERMSEHIWTHYENNRQDARMYEWKQNVLAHIDATVEFALPESSAQLFSTGSTVNGCGAYNSDMDVCLLLPSPYGDLQADRRFAVAALKSIQEAIAVCDTGSRLVYRAQYINAKVPILRLHLRKPYDVIEVDININNIEGIYNSHLCRHYARLDPRFPALALLIKHWAIRADINNPYDGTLNSYSLILLLVHFLQCAVRPWVLPNLFKLFPEYFDEKIIHLNDLRDVNLLPSQIDGLNGNKQAVSELLVGFFTYYAKFDFARDAISVRDACVFNRSVLNTATASSVMDFQNYTLNDF